MGKSLQAIRGMNDILPPDSHIWLMIENEISSILTTYGYEQIRTPILESTDVFLRTIGEVTDIVSKEMYTFNDRNGDSLSLRPEGTACCVRSLIQHGMLRNQVQKVWYQGPMFRHERPQKGRYRQFHQVGVEVFGVPDIYADLELILISNRIWKKLGIAKNLTLEINSLGSIESRSKFRNELVTYFSKYQSDFSAEQKEKLANNPLRLLDTKDENLKEIIQSAPSILEYLNNEERETFEQIIAFLDQSGIQYQVNSKIVRGLDYYNNLVFEWVTKQLGAQGTVCAGGRYDNLVSLMGGQDTPAAGFAIGLERLILLYSNQVEELPKKKVKAYMILEGQDSKFAGLLLSEQIRDKMPDFLIEVNTSSASFKSQFKKADKSGARLALIIGEQEFKNKKVSVKFLREDRPQIELNHIDLLKLLNEYL